MDCTLASCAECSTECPLRCCKPAPTLLILVKSDEKGAASCTASQALRARDPQKCTWAKQNGLDCRFSSALSASIWGHSSQVLVFSSTWVHTRRDVIMTHFVLFSSILGIFEDPPNTVKQGKTQRVTNRPPTFPSPCVHALQPGPESPKKSGRRRGVPERSSPTGLVPSQKSPKKANRGHFNTLSLSLYLYVFLFFSPFFSTDREPCQTLC